MDENTERLERIDYAKCLVEIGPENELVHHFDIMSVMEIKREFKFNISGNLMSVPNLKCLAIVLQAVKLQMFLVKRI